MIVVIAVVFWAIFLCYGAGTGAALLVPRTGRALVTSMACSSLAAMLASLVGLGVLFGSSPPVGQVETGLPFGSLTVGVDPLSAFFLIVIGMVSFAVAVYAVGYLRRHVGHRSLRSALVVFNLLLLSLILIVSATDAITFLLAWEGMAVLTYLAVNFEYEKPRVINASYLMLAVNELGMIGIVGSILFLGQAGGGFSFDALRLGASRLSPLLRDVVFVLAFFGFGAKAGILPLQLWLPEAHPAAPSHLSALLSAVIVKMGVYGMVRVLISFLGGGPVWWGLLMLALGAVTALIGILHAFIERDLKRILAYSTIENVGIIVAAVGLSLVYHGAGLDALATITVLFAFYHLLNHAAYKGLLFLGAGAVDEATGTRDLDRLGGLVRRMPWTATAFLVGSLAIAAVAPFGGYITEWGILEAMLQSFALPDVPTRLVVASAASVIALSAALAVTTFVRAYAVGFLALPRSESASSAREVPAVMRMAMGFLAVAVILLGVVPAFVITVLDRTSTPLWGTSVLNRVVPPLFTEHPGNYAVLVSLGGGLFRGLPINGLVVIPSPTFSTINSPTYLLLGEIILLGVLVAGLRSVHRFGLERSGPVWAGGIPSFEPRMQYGAVAYSNPGRLIFNGIYRSRAEFAMISAAALHGDGVMNYRQDVPSPLVRSVYRPVARGIEAIAARAKAVQSGSTNQYVIYIFAMVLIILVLQGAEWGSWLTYGLYLLATGIIVLVLRGVREDGHRDPW